MKILSLSFFSAIWPHSYPEFSILKGLKEKYQCDIDFLSCNRDFNSCVVHDSESVEINNIKQKNKICEFCINTKNFYKKNSQFRFLELNSILTSEDKIEIQIILKDTNQDNFFKKEVFGVLFGKYTLFNYFIRYKKSSINFELNEFESFKLRLEDSLKSLFAVKRLIDNNKYSCIVSYSSEYSINKICSEYAKKKGIEVFTIIAGKQTLSKFKFLKIAKGYNEGHYYHANQKWNIFKNINLTKEDLFYPCEYINSFLTSDTFMNYSLKVNNLDIRKHFSIPETYKKIILVAISSDDERIGDNYLGVKQSETKKCHSTIFADDLEWVEWLLKKTHEFENIFFIIRFHPRSFSTKRNSNTSGQLKKILELSSLKFNNVAFDLPKNNISVFDYIPCVNLLLHSSSSLSFEFGLFGIPSLTYDRNLYYFTDDLTYSAENLSEYLFKIKVLLNEKNINRKEIIVNSFKWLILQLNYEFVNISDIFDPNTRNIFFRLLNKISKITNNNLIVKYALGNIKIPKNISIFHDILLKNYDSVLDITLKKKNNFNILKIDNEFLYCKKEMLKLLDNKRRLLNFYKKII